MTAPRVVRGMLPSIVGMNLIESPHLTYRARRIARRSWRERLFSLNPCESRKIVVIDFPSRAFYVTKDSIICHPVRAQQLLNTLERGNRYER